MQVENRKREGGGAEGEKENGAVLGGATSADEEVEEFFAILRRLHAAAAYFSGGKRKYQSSDGSDDHQKGGARWSPAFVIENFEAASEDGCAGESRKKGSPEARRKNGERPAVEEEVGRVQCMFDLNRHPESEADPGHDGPCNRGGGPSS